MSGGLTEFVGIYLENGLEPGKLRMAATGMGWKGEREDKPTTISAGDLRYMQWIRVGRGFQLRVNLKGEKRRVGFEGFSREDHERLKNSAQNYYNITLEEVETSVRGWNWGAADVQADDLAFLVAGKPAFNIPLRTVHNTSINKQEVAIEFRDEKLLGEIKKLEEDQTKEARRLRRAAPDELVEVRFYIPGTVGTQRRRQKAAKKEANGEKIKKEEDEDVKMEEDSDEESLEGSEAEGEDKEAAENFFETIKEKAEIGQVQGETLVSFPEVLCTTPRGRFDVDMFPDFLRLRGKTYDYKILYASIVKLFLLPRVDDIHVQFIINLEPPIRQGQTRYPYLIMQFAKEEEMDAEIQLDEEILKEKYDGRLEKRYEAPAYEVVSTIFRVLSGKKITSPGSFQSHGGHSAVKANLGANEGYIFLLDKSMLYISKLPMFLPYADISEIRFERVSGALTSSARTFDLIVQTRSGGRNEHTFSAVSKEEQSVMEDFLKRDKKLRVKNVLEENANAVNSAIAEALLDDDDSEDDDKPRRAEGDEDEDSEVDEDFKAESGDDDVEEEFNENYSGSSSSGSESDEGDDDEDNSDNEMDEDSLEKPAPTKKKKAADSDASLPAKKKQKKDA